MRKPTFRETFRYASFVWLTGVIVAPLLFYILGGFLHNADLMGGMGFIAMVILYGGIFSTPCWLLLILAATIVKQFTARDMVQKSSLFVIATILTYAPFLFMFGGGIAFDGGFSMIISYWLAISFGIFYYNLKRPEKPEAPLDGPLDQL